MLPSDVLLAAADAIQQFGWCKGESIDEKDRVCTLGAMNMVTGAWDYTAESLGLARATQHLFRQAVLPRKAKGSMLTAAASIVDWNDSNRRRRADVIRALHKAAARATKLGF